MTVLFVSRGSAHSHDQHGVPVKLLDRMQWLAVASAVIDANGRRVPIRATIAAAVISAGVSNTCESRLTLQAGLSRLKDDAPSSRPWVGM